MTYAEAYKLGYRPRGRQTYQKGYIRRKGYEIEDQEVHAAGGSRKGHQLYVLMPAYNTSRYCIRQYLVKTIVTGQNYMDGRED